MSKMTLCELINNSTNWKSLCLLRPIIQRSFIFKPLCTECNIFCLIGVLLEVLEVIKLFSDFSSDYYNLLIGSLVFSFNVVTFDLFNYLLLSALHIKSFSFQFMQKNNH